MNVGMLMRQARPKMSTDFERMFFDISNNFRRRSRLIDPDGGRFSYSYDAASRMTRVINPQGKRTTLTYDPLARQTGQIHGNGSRTTQSYDGAGRMIGQIQGDGVGLSRRTTYVYDPTGRRTLSNESSGTRTTWAYDSSGQLHNEQRNGANSFNVSHIFDPAGNRTLMIDSGTRTTATYDAANELLVQKIGSARTTYQYDNNGNTTRKDTGTALTLYTWDVKNRMSLAVPIGTLVTCTYSGDDKRVKKQVGLTTTQFLYDFENVLRESDGGGTVQREYTSTTEQYGELLSAFGGGSTSYYEFTPQYSTEALLDDTGAVSDRYRYLAFGLATHTQGSSTQPQTFVGKQRYYNDLELSLYYAGRYYDPASARWRSTDKDGYRHGPNLLKYCDNDPVNNTDPSGRLLFAIGDEAKNRVLDQYAKYFNRRLAVREVQEVGGWLLNDPKFNEATPDGTKIYLILAPWRISAEDVQQVSGDIDRVEMQGLEGALKLGLEALRGTPIGVNRVFSIPPDGQVQDWATGNDYLQIGKDSFDLDTPFRSYTVKQGIWRRYESWWVYAGYRPVSEIKPLSRDVIIPCPGSNRPVSDFVISVLQPVGDTAGLAIDIGRKIVNSDAKPFYSRHLVDNREGTINEQQTLDRIERDLIGAAGFVGPPVAKFLFREASLGSGILTRAERVSANKFAGDAVRDIIAAREAPALIEQSMTTVGGIRKIDVLKLGDELVAIESKVGQTALGSRGSRVRQELARDWWLQRQGQVDRVVWEFSRSDVTGKVGPRQKLLEKLQKLGFDVRINP